MNDLSKALLIVTYSEQIISNKFIPAIGLCGKGMPKHDGFGAIRSG